VAGLNVDGAHPALNCLKSHEQRNSAAVTKGCDEQVAVPPLLTFHFCQRRAALTPRAAHPAHPFHGHCAHKGNRGACCTPALLAL
jgi:hypothetical protein